MTLKDIVGELNPEINIADLSYNHHEVNVPIDDHFQRTMAARALLVSDPFLSQFINDRTSYHGGIETRVMNGRTQIGYLTDDQDTTITQWFDNGQVVETTTITGDLRISESGGRVDIGWVVRDENGEIKKDANGKPVTIDAGRIGSAFGSAIGSLIIDDDANLFERTVGGLFFSVIGQNLGQTIAATLTESTIGAATKKAFSDIGLDVKTATQGVISSLLAAEIVSELGIDGELGAFATAAGGAIILESYSALSSSEVGFNWDNVGTAAKGFIYSYIGSQIGAAIYDVKTKEGAVGAQLGAAIGAEIGTAILPGIGTIVGAAVGFVVGGIFGDLFHDYDESGARVIYDPVKGAFRGWSYYGDSDGYPVVTSISGSVASLFNGLLEASGATVVSDERVHMGTYAFKEKYFMWFPQDNKQGGKVKFGNDSEAAINYGIIKSFNSLMLDGGNI